MQTESKKILEIENKASLFACPHCKSTLNEQLKCVSAECGRVYSTKDTIPILIDKDNSIFDPAQIAKRNVFFNRSGKRWRLWDPHRKLTLRSLGLASAKNFRKLADLLGEKNYSRVLIIGGGSLGQGLKSIIDLPNIEFIECDVFLGPRTQIVCDAHSLPFTNCSFDGVIIQAVLEHVLDPHQCVKEIYRVLDKDGIVYAETPFMQQVHGAQFDFTRFTHLGHRRLFRWFTEIESGVVCGPGMALAWSYQFFLLSFSHNRKIREFLKVVSWITSFYLHFFDYFLIKKASALDAASGLFFMGRKAVTPISDKELIGSFRGVPFTLE